MASLFLSFISLIVVVWGHFENSSQRDSNDLYACGINIKGVSKISDQDSVFLITGWYYIVDTGNGVERQLDRSDLRFFIDPIPIVTVKNFTTFEVYESETDGGKMIGLTIRLDKKGAASWSIATKKITGKKLAFILDNRLLYAPIVNSQITGGVAAINRGIYTRAELESFKAIMEKEK